MSVPDRVLAGPGRLSLAVSERALVVLALLIAGLAVLMAASLMIGSYPVSFTGVLQTLFVAPVSETAGTVVWEFRFPRALAAAFTGALMATSGAILQNVTRNPLADPSLVGVSQGAGLAVVASMIAFPWLPHALRPFLAFGGALAVAALIQWIAMRRTGDATMRFILTGIGIAAFISAATNAMLTYGEINQALAALGWLAGSVHAAGWAEVQSLTVCTLVVAPLVGWAARPMAAMRMGPVVATGLGVAVRPMRILLITLAVALAAFAVAAVGPLGFVGLIAPHLARRLARSGVGLHLAMTAAVGALLVLMADFLGRTLFAPVQIPAGVVTAVIGVPVFVWLILRFRSQTND